VTGIKQVHGYAVSMNTPNIDTDQIIPARFLLRSRDAGYGELLFRDSRFDKTGRKLSEHVLNYPGDQAISILMVDQNFGCGSAREQAAYALYDYGIRAIVARSFGEIFRINCVRTGIIPAIVSDEDARTLHSLLDSKGGFMNIDLQNRLITADSIQVKFDIEDVNADRLINDRDEIQETLALEREISAFELRM